VILIAYFFDITSRQTKIPGVLLLVLTGMAIRSVTGYYNLNIPEIDRILPVLGTLGLVLIVLDSSLDLKLSRRKSILIAKSLSSSVLLFLIFVGFFTFISVLFFHYDTKTSIINIIPLGIISSAVAIPSAFGLSKSDREFVIYESSMSDIFGILVFNYIFFSNGSLNAGYFLFFGEIIITLMISILFSAGLTVMLHKINHNIKHIFIMTFIVLIYALAKLIHLPSLFVVFIFGLFMNNNILFKNNYSAKIINFEEFNADLNSFKNITAELTFIVRSFFFILFGYYIRLGELLNLRNLIIALIITLTIFILRALYLKFILRYPLKPLLFFAPRGLITILLFLSIPQSMLLPLISTSVITYVIFISILIMSFGNIIFNKVDELVTSDSDINLINSEN
jgi:Kef-type K+ transport system membrane component KefB